jgi:uncharacterized cupredoxin-like copper-binding protein
MKILLAAFALSANMVLAVAAYAAPELAVEQGNFNFGTIPQGKTVQHNFIIKNHGDAPLQIKQLSASCGCTAAKSSSSLIAPGRSAEIQVSFDSSNFNGTVEKTVTMTTNAGKIPSYTFKLEGNIIESMQVTPRQVNMGPLVAGVGKQATITVTNMGGSSVKLLSVNMSSVALQAKATIKKAELKPGESGTIELTVTARPEGKVLSGYLHVVTNNPQKKEITVPVYGSAAK